MTKLIIEHLEPRLWKWCLVEYEHISNKIGKENLVFTNIKHKSEARKLEKIGKVYSDSVMKLRLKDICILDPTAKETLSKKDRKFKFVLLGGILGDFPPRKRTKKELTEVLGYPARNLGHYQMSTNTAAYVAWKILKGIPLTKMKFRRGIKAKVGDFEEIELPFRFLIEDGKIFMPKNYMDLVKKKW